MYSWVLSVGATQQAQLPGTNGAIGPVTCMGPTSLAITSTGKIFPSNLIAMPDYQAQAVADYLNSEEFKSWNYPPHTIASPGRSIPDVSAYGAFIPTMLEDLGAPFADNVGGTSASSPAFAGLLLQVRGALLQAPECANKTIKFGHINPMIYWMLQNRPAAFTDITIGNNIYDGQFGYTYDLTNCDQGYVAAKGWDPVTGVGMMNFPGFVEAAKEWMCLGIGLSSVQPSMVASPPTLPPHLVPCSRKGNPCTVSSDCCSSKLGCFGKKLSISTCNKCAKKNQMCLSHSDCCQAFKKFKCDSKKKKCVSCLKSGSKCKQSKKCCSNKCKRNKMTGQKLCTNVKRS